MHALQVALLVALGAIAAAQVRALCFRGPVDLEPLLAALRRAAGEGDRRAIAQAIAGTFVGRAIAPITGDPAEREDPLDVALEESLLEARSEIVRGLAALRIGGTLSTFLGFLGAAIALTWIHAGDHGLLGLDPSRVTAVGTNGAALSIALGVGGSSFAIGAWMTLRGQARRLTSECERAVDRVRPSHARPGD